MNLNFNSNVNNEISSNLKEIIFEMCNRVINYAVTLIYFYDFDSVYSPQLKRKSEYWPQCLIVDRSHFVSCDANATCTEDLMDRNRHTCVCNSGFQGNGFACQGKRVL